MKIQDLQNPKYLLIQDDGDILELNSNYNQDYDGYLITIEDGDYGEVYGFRGCVPFLDKSVTRVK